MTNKEDLIFHNLDDLLAEEMQDPDFAIAFQRSQQRREILSALKTQREAQNLTLADIAEKSGLKVQNISRLERGENSPTLDTLLSYINALGGSLDINFHRETTV